MAYDYTPAQRTRFSSTGFYPELWDACWIHQGGMCAICRCALVERKAPGAHHACADHCHTDKLPRGILCHWCNMSLGAYEKHQRLHGLLIGPYEHYLAAWPTRAFPRPQRTQRAYTRSR